MKKYKLLRLFILVGVLLLIFSVTPAVIADESEPNDSSATADVLTSPADADWGNISPTGDDDWWVMGGASVGDLIFVYIDTSGSSSSLDSVLDVYANDQATSIELDDDDGPPPGIFTSSVVAGAIVPQAGNVYFWVYEWIGDELITPYGIYAAVLDPVTDSMNEVEPNNTWQTATPISALKIVNANMPVGGDTYDYFSFNALAGDVIAVSMDDDPDDDTNLFDSELDLLGTDGSTVLATGDNELGHGGNAAGAVIIPADGTYYVRVSDGGEGSADTNYRFVIHGLAYSPPTPTPTPTPPPPPSAIPTLSQWGMIGMAIVLAAFLVWSVRRRWVISADKS